MWYELLGKFFEYSLILLGIVFCLIVIFLYYFGKKLREKDLKDFKLQMKIDLTNALETICDYPKTKLEEKIERLLSPSKDVDLGEKCIQINMQFSRDDADKSMVNRIINITYLKEGKVFTTSLKRAYNVDFLPSEISAALIRSSGNDINVLVYNKK